MPASATLCTFFEVLSLPCTDRWTHCNKNKNSDARWGACAVVYIKVLGRRRDFCSFWLRTPARWI
uniref:Uncharacterized protein n=1 Tax=Anguilla anguilla TaxID=7936 RepID=A0A0E9QE25_ANGAN